MSDIPSFKTRCRIRTRALIKSISISFYQFYFHFALTLFVYGHSPYRAVRSHNTGFQEVRSHRQDFRRSPGVRIPYPGWYYKYMYYVYTSNVFDYVYYVYYVYDIYIRVYLCVRWGILLFLMCPFLLYTVIIEFIWPICNSIILVLCTCMCVIVI